MKRIVWLMAVLAVMLSFVNPSLAYAGEREAGVLVERPALVIKAVVAGISGRSSYEYIELYNPNLYDVMLDSWTLTHLRKEGTVTQTFILHGTVKASSSVLLAGSDAELAALIPDFTLKESSIVTTGGIVRLANTEQHILEEVRWGDTVPEGGLILATGSILQRRFNQGAPLQTGDIKQDYQSVLLVNYLPGRGGYVPYSPPVNECTGVIISEIAANVSLDRQFIELYNVMSDSIALDGCLLQTNRSATKSYELTGVLDAGEYRAYMVATTELQLTKTTSGSVYLLASDGESETDARSYESLSEETSWMRQETGDWQQTFNLTPGGENIWQEFLPCDTGYERSLETGRCRKVEIEAAVVSECEAGKYRNPETGRCKAIETGNDATITSCRSDQYRSPETNRCRSFAATTSLVACRENQERNPETNRCHEVASATPLATEFSVEPTKEVAKAFAGWWVLGGVGILGLAYAGWEWRNEVGAIIRKTGTFFQFSK